MPFKDFFSRQARKPTGIFGRFFMPAFFNKGNSALNKRMTELVAANGNDQILEIGFGTGTVINAMAHGLTDGTIEGIDFSNAMLNVAKRKNRHHIAAGTVSLTHGNFDEIAYPPEKFDTVCSGNTIYFWPSPDATVSKVFDTLKSNGTLVLAFVDERKMKNMPLNMGIFRPISLSSVHELLKNNGFSCIETHPVNGQESAMYCVTARKQ